MGIKGKTEKSHGYTDLLTIPFSFSPICNLALKLESQHFRDHHRNSEVPVPLVDTHYPVVFHHQ